MQFMNLKWQLSHTRGYLELGMLDEAEAELRGLSPEHREHPAALALLVEIAQQREKWSLMAHAAKRLSEKCPEDPASWIMFAYAIRRSQNIYAARKILLHAHKEFPDEATILYNLGCYAAVLQDVKEAQRYLHRAFYLDKELMETARTDPDIDNVREAMGL